MFFFNFFFIPQLGGVFIGGGIDVFFLLLL